MITFNGGGMSPLRTLTAVYRGLSVMQNILCAQISNVEMANRLQTSAVIPLYRKNY